MQPLRTFAVAAILNGLLLVGEAAFLSNAASAHAAAYPAVVNAKLQRQMRYPDAAVAKGQQGTARVTFRVGPNGRVLDVRLEQSSGHELLDKEAQAMVRRAQPFPPTPDRHTHTFTAPINFAIKPKQLPAYTRTVLEKIARHMRGGPRFGAEGRVVVAFRLTNDGNAADIRVHHSSGNRFLDEDAQAAVRRASPFPPPPDVGMRSFAVPITYSLKGLVIDRSRQLWLD